MHEKSVDLYLDNKLYLKLLSKIVLQHIFNCLLFSFTCIFVVILSVCFKSVLIIFKGNIYFINDWF